MIYCSSNFKYNEFTKRCECFDTFIGSDCTQSTRKTCLHGIYNLEEDSCRCFPNYYGENCENKYDCNHGYMIEDVCMCYDGFSGDSCSIIRKESPLEREMKDKLLETYHSKPCKHGAYNNDTNICECDVGFNGLDCSIYSCKHGIYNSVSELCECFDGYYGEECDINCEKDCNYNGNKCNINHQCDCYDSWRGEKCDIIDIAIEHESNISFIISSSLEISIQRRNENMEESSIIDNSLFESITCYTTDCIPFKIVNSFNNRGRLLSVNETNSLQSDTYFIYMSNSLVNRTMNESVYIYPNNDYNLSYYGGIDTIIYNVTYGIDEIFFYIETVRPSDFKLLELNGNNTYNIITDGDINGDINGDITNSTHDSEDSFGDDDLINLNNTVIVNNDTVYENNTISSDGDLTNHNSQNTENKVSDTTGSHSSNIIIGSSVTIGIIIISGLMIKKYKNNQSKVPSVRKYSTTTQHYTHPNLKKGTTYTVNSMYFNQLHKSPKKEIGTIKHSMV